MLGTTCGVLDQVDLASIAGRERVTRHDVKARIEEFNALAGHEHVHKGMTSRDLTENVEQLQVGRLLHDARPGGGLLARLAALAAEHGDRSWPRARTMSPRRPLPSASGSPPPADEVLVAFGRLEELIVRSRCGGSRARSVPRRTCSTCSATRPPWPRWRTMSPRIWGLSGFTSVGQVSPRSLDYDVLSTLVQLAAAPSSLAKTIRLMAGHELATEGFKRARSARPPCRTR